MLFESPVGASPLDVPEDLVEFYLNRGFKPVEQKANEPKAAKPKATRTRRTTKKTE